MERYRLPTGVYTPNEGATGSDGSLRVGLHWVWMFSSSCVYFHDSGMARFEAEQSKAMQNNAKHDLIHMLGSEEGIFHPDDPHKRQTPDADAERTFLSLLRAPGSKGKGRKKKGVLRLPRKPCKRRSVALLVLLQLRSQLRIVALQRLPRAHLLLVNDVLLSVSPQILLQRAVAAAGLLL